MSNALAIAAATRTLAQMLDEELQRDFVGAHVIPGRPDIAAGAEAGPEVRVFLYRVEPNPSWRTAALPARSPAGQIYERPQIGLTLHYLLSFIGDEAGLEPQRMLGSVVRTLNSRPLLTRAEIEEMVQAALAAVPADPLALSDLAEQPEIVRLSPLPLTLDELSNLWSSFFQAPYRLSVAYEACVVVLTADDTPTRSLPVRDRRLFVTTLLRPTITRIIPGAGPLTPIRIGTDVEIHGTQLKGEETTVVMFGAVPATPMPDATTSRQITIAVPAGARAGVSGVQVVHRRLMGEPPAERRAGQSNVAPIIIQPQLTPPAPAVHDVVVGAGGFRSGGVSLTVDPPVSSRQAVTLLLNAVPGGSGQSYVFEDERREGPADPAETSALDVPFRGVVAGTYLVRVGVDGAESELDFDDMQGSPTEGLYTGPTVTIP